MMIRSGGASGRTHTGAGADQTRRSSAGRARADDEAPAAPFTLTPATTSSATGIPAGFPTGTNTGVQVGTVLKNVPGQVSSGPGWTWNPAGGGYADVTGNGANLSGLRIPGNVDVSGNNVTLNNVSITVSGGGDTYGVDLRHTANVTIEHSSIQGTDLTTGRLGEGIKDVYGDATGTKVLDNDIQKTDTAVQIFQGTIQGNYIHNLGMISTDHVNGITTNGDTHPLLIQNNTILNSSARPMPSGCSRTSVWCPT